jgi:multiple sugar transport system ATP-binding protein
MATVEMRGLTKMFGDVCAVCDLDLTVHDKEFLTLLGPSGCGKSTTLNMIAGLEKPTRGELLLDGRLINRVPPARRDVAMVFQNYALYPHMNVRDNLGFALRIRNVPASEIDVKVREAARMLSIEDLLHRKPRELSGGQRQRVALGRALVRNPKVFLLDEPLSNLDAILRVQMRAELKMLFNRLQATVIYVTHDQAEAMTMSDRIAILNKGVVQQVDTPLQIYHAPRNQFVATFVGSPPINLVPCELVREVDRILARTPDFTVDLSSLGGQHNISTGTALSPPKGSMHRLAAVLGQKLRLGMRPEEIHPTSAEGEGAIRCRLEVVEQLGAATIFYLNTGSIFLTMEVPGSLAAQPGSQMAVRVAVDKVYLFRQDGETVLAPGWRSQA